MKGEKGTWIDPEEVCSDIGQFRRKGEARHEDTGELVRIRASTPDTFFSIPATTDKQHGFVTSDDGVLVFNPHTDQDISPKEYRRRHARDCR